MTGAAATTKTPHVRARREGAWTVFETAAGARRPDPLDGQLGRPGLWRLRRPGRGLTARRVFELPASLLPDRPGDPPHGDGMAAWVRTSAAGRVEPGWSPPPEAEVQGWLPARALTLRVRAIAVQGTVIGDRRLALAFPVVCGIPDDLPAARAAWLRELLADAQDRWRLVRIGLDGGTVRAEVDLTGAPRTALEPLVRIGVDALRHVVSMLVEPADFLVNGAAVCRAVEVPPTPRRTAR